LDELRAAREEGLLITVETCPHYLHFAAEEIAEGATLWKCAPPIRGKANREALWKGLAEGVIDLVVTDHSPCPPAMKCVEEGNFQTAWGGVASLSVALPVMWTEARRRGFTLPQVVHWMSTMPARLVGLQKQKGEIARGLDADLVVFDSDVELRVTQERLYYRHPLSSYVGETLCGLVKATYVRGVLVFEDGRFPGEPIGRECRRVA
jgi:allantoinase